MKTKNEYEDYLCWCYCFSSVVCDVGVAGKNNGDVVSVAFKFTVVVEGYDIGIVIVIVKVFVLVDLVLRLFHLFVFDSFVLEDVAVNLQECVDLLDFVSSLLQF